MEHSNAKDEVEENFHVKATEMTISADKSSKSSLGTGLPDPRRWPRGEIWDGVEAVRAVRTESEAHPKMKTRYLLEWPL